MVDINDVQYDAITVMQEFWRRGGDTGCLYVIEFSSEWVKVGQTTVWPGRLQNIRRDFRKRYGWEIVREWQSTQVSALPLQEADRSDLRDLEQRLIRHASTTGERLSNHSTGRGIGESETFLGCTFGDLVAYSDVLALCSTPDNPAVHSAFSLTADLRPG